MQHYRGQSRMMGWHWLDIDRKLRYDDGRKVRLGKKLSVKTHMDRMAIEVCQFGMHASPTVYHSITHLPHIIALNARGGYLCRVILDDVRDSDGNRHTKPTKYAALSRTVIAIVKLTNKEVCELRDIANQLSNPHVLSRQVNQIVRKIMYSSRARYAYGYKPSDCGL